MIHTQETPFGHSDFPVQSLWIGELGMLERLSMASFLANGHPYHLYAYDLSLPVPPGVQLKDAREILPESAIFTYTSGKSAGGYSAFADLFRYTLLAKKGGWWADTDMICLRPFRFDSPLVLASERHWLWRKKLSVAVIFAPTGHPLMQACAHDAASTSRKQVRFAQNGEPILRRHVTAQKLQAFVQAPLVFNPIDWWRSDTIAKPGSASLILPQSYAIHCFGESWRWRLKEAYAQGFHNRAFTPDTLIGELQRRYADYMGLPRG